MVAARHGVGRAQAAQSAGRRDDRPLRAQPLSGRLFPSHGTKRYIACSAVAIELRGAVRLADLWICQGERDQARKLLGPICESFTEELDTPDYKQAVEVLHVLQSWIGCRQHWRTSNVYAKWLGNEDPPSLGPMSAIAASEDVFGGSHAESLTWSKSDRHTKLGHNPSTRLALGFRRRMWLTQKARAHHCVALRMCAKIPAVKLPSQHLPRETSVPRRRLPA
jgi:hypothetical protein